MLLLHVGNGGTSHGKTWQVGLRGFKQFPARREPFRHKLSLLRKREYHQPLPTNLAASSLRYKKAVISQMLNILKKSEKKVWRRCEKRGTLQPSKLFKIEQLFPLKFFSENFFSSFLAHLRVSFLAFFPFHLKIWIIIKSQGEKWESLFQFSWRCISVFRHLSLSLWARHPPLKADPGPWRLSPFSWAASSLPPPLPPALTSPVWW